MSDINFPLTALELESYIKQLIGYTFEFSVINNIINNINQGASLDSLMTNDDFNNLYEAVKSGYSIKCVGSQNIINVGYSTCEEVTADDFKCVEIGFIYNSKYIKLSFSKFSSNIYLDGKTVKEL